MTKPTIYKYSGYIILAALFWGMIGIFVKGLSKIGLTAMEIVTIRVMFSCLFLFIYGVSSKNNQMKIDIKDTYLFIGTGILSISFFNWAYFTSINMLSLSVAVILLYTAPAFVMILSVIFLKEKITGSKVILLCMTLIGCFLVTGISGKGLEGGNLLGYLIGLGSGFGYALYSIFGKFAIAKYSAFTVSFYTFFIASIVLVPYTQIWTVLHKLMSLEAVLQVIGLCLISTVFAFLLYTEGLKGVESSKASILSTVEPLAAMIIGIVIYKDSINTTQLLGGFVIFASAILASVNLSNLIRMKKMSK